MILGAANNTNTTTQNLGKIHYQYHTRPADANPNPVDGTTKYSVPQGAQEVKADVDLFNRWGLVVEKFNNNDGVAGKLSEASNGWKTDPNIKKPLETSSVMAGSSFLGIFISMFIIRIIDSTEVFVYISLIFSLMAIISIFCGVLVGNHQDKVKLKVVDIQKEHLEYTGIREYRQGTDFENLGQGTEAPSGTKTVSASTFDGTNKVYFQVTATGSKPNPPQVQVKAGTDISDQTLGIVKANIIVDIGILHCLK